MSRHYVLTLIERIPLTVVRWEKIESRDNLEPRALAERTATRDAVNDNRR